MNKSILHYFGNVSFIIILGIITTLSFLGCKKSGADRQDVWGTITWKGQPIPDGFVYFTPDLSKGNEGPPGIAKIKNGTFDTRFEKSRGCIAGPHIVEVHAHDGKDIHRMLPYGHAMFAEYPVLKDPITIPDDGGKFDLVVPDSTPPAKASGARAEVE